MNNIILISLLLTLVDNCFSQSKLNIHQFPEPEKTNERLFYIQRSLNQNTIVYDASFDENGMLNLENPVNVYWIRYEEKGQIMPLRFFEKQFAFGVSTEKLINQEYDYKVTIAAWNKRVIFIKQIAPFRAVAYLNINGTDSILNHIFIGSDPEGRLTRAEYIELYGLVQETSIQNHERIFL